MNKGFESLSIEHWKIEILEMFLVCARLGNKKSDFPDL